MVKGNHAVIGVFCCYCRATTHSDLLLRAADMGVGFRVIHNASIMNAVGCCGLQLYHFGETISIPYWTDSWKPDSFLDKIESNLHSRLHTLCLLGGCGSWWMGVVVLTWCGEGCSKGGHGQG